MGVVIAERTAEHLLLVEGDRTEPQGVLHKQVLQVVTSLVKDQIVVVLRRVEQADVCWVAREMLVVICADWSACLFYNFEGAHDRVAVA